MTRELTEQELARLVELDEAITKFEGQKRWSDVIKSILAKAEIVLLAGEKVALLTQAGQMFLERSSNQAEAIKCFEQVVELDPDNAAAMASLREMYEKRRDWEKLVRVMEREAALLPASERGARYIEMAQLATERLRKPEICIELWQKVLASDPDHPEALAALSGLYERAREWKPLAEVLEKQSERLGAGDEQKVLLAKLGMVYADKLSDDRGAVSAFQRLLALDPEDRRAQEQLKRRYVAIKAWDDLESFYRQTGKLDELIRALEREAQNKDAPLVEQVDLMFRVARLWLESEKVDRATKAFEKVLELDPESVGAARSLAPMYEAAGDAKKLVGVLEVRLRHVDDPEERIVLLREIAVLCEERLKRSEDAFARLLEAFGLDPSRELLREDLARLAPQIEGWPRVVAAYSAAVEGASDETLQVTLRLGLGKIHAANGAVEEAILQYRAVCALQPEHREAIAALEELYRTTGKHQSLLEILEFRIGLEEASEVRRQLSYDRAALLEGELADAARATEAYREILVEWGDGERDAYRALDGLFERQSRWADLAEAIERRLDLGPADDEELGSLKFRLGRVFDAHPDADTTGQGRARALELYREVLALMPDHDGARTALESMLEDSSMGSDAAALLEPIYETRNEWTSLVLCLEVLVRGADDPVRQLELLTKVGEVASVHLADPALAFDAFARAVRVAPDDTSAHERLAEVASEHGKFADVVHLLEELAAASTDPSLARGLWLRAARIHESHLGAFDSAVADFQKVLALDEGDAEALDALDALYRSSSPTELGRQRARVEILRRKAARADEVSVQAGLLAEVALLHESVLSEPTLAVAVFKEILELDPEHRQSLDALDRLYEGLGLWAEQADVLDRQLQLAIDPAEESAWMLRLATLRESRMGEVDAAIEIHRAILERDPAQEGALAALSRLLEVPAQQAVVAEILEPIYRASASYAQLVHVHEIQAALAESSERRVELLHRIAELQEVALDDVESAFRSYARALDVDPANADTLGALERLAQVTGDHEALAGAYEARVSRFYEESAEGRPAGDEAVTAALLLTKAADVREHNLADLDTAMAHHQRVLDLDGQSLGAATALERLYQQTERYGLLAAILVDKSQILESLEEQKEHLFRAAAIHEDLLESPNDAIGVYRRIHELDSEDLPSLDKLIELLLKLERWSDLLGAYASKAEVVSDADEKKRLYLEVGAVYERELGDRERAIDTYQRILELDPSDLVAIGRLDALFLATENWQELRQVLEREADLASDPDEVIGFRYRIAQLHDHKLDDASRAVEGYQDILEMDPGHAPTIGALEAMIRAGKLALSAAGVLEPVYRQTGAWGRLVGVLEVQTRHAEDLRARVELLHQIAQLQEFQLEDGRAAFDAYARALPFDSSDDGSLSNLERLGHELDALAEVTRLYDSEAAKCEDEPERRIDLLMRAAQLHEVHLGDVDAALVRYGSVLETDEAHPQAIEALDRLYEATERWDELSRVLAREVQLAGSPDTMLDLQYRLGSVLEQRLGRVDSAIEQYREILAAAPEHADALGAMERLFAEGVEPLAIAETLEPLYRMQESWERLMGVHQVTLEHRVDLDERRTLMQRIAEIAEDHAGDAQTAFEWHQRILLEAPLDDQSTSEAERLAAALGNWEQLASSLTRVFETPREEAVAVSVGKRLARIYETEIGDTRRASEAHLYVLGVVPTDAECLEALDRIYSEHGASELLQEVLRRRAAATSDPRDVLELTFRRAAVLENDLGRVDEAVGVYLHLLDHLDAEHEESIAALASIFTEKQDWVRLLEVFERELKVALGDGGRADVLARMARVADERLGDASRAVSLWREVLELRGEDAEALSALGDLHARSEQWAELVDTLDREASIAVDDDERVRIFSDLARIWRGKLSNEQQAVENWQRVLDVDPTSTDALFGLAEIQKVAGEHRDLADTLQRVAEVGGATLDDSVLEVVFMELGALYERTLEEPADAVDAYRKALDVNPSNFIAMDALQSIHSADGSWVDVVQVMERRVEAFDGVEDKVAGLLDIAEVWSSKQGEPDRGTSAFERVLGLDPRHALAFERLDELHRAAGRWENLVEVFITRTETAESSAERVGLLRRIAEVQDTKLGNKADAFDTLLIAWEDDYEDRRTADALEKIAGETRRWSELVNAANAALQQATETGVKVALCLRCAKWYAGELGHPEYAIPYYQQIQKLDPNNVPALQQLGELYRGTQQWQQLAQSLGAIVGLTNDPLVKADTFVQMGELCESHLGIPEQARGYYQQALEASPDHIGALEALERVYRGAGEWEALLDIQRRKAGATDDVARVVESKLEIAETYEDRLGNVEQAVETYRQVLEADSGNLRALKGLERLYARAERWTDLVQVLEQQYEFLRTEKERIQVLLRVASMWEEEFVKPEKAAERLEAVLEIDPGNDAALRALERIYRSAQRWDLLIHTFERHVSATPDRSEKQAIFLGIGEVYAVELNDLDRAVDAFLNVLSIQPESARALESLARAYERRGDHGQAFDAMLQLSKIPQDPAHVVDLRFRMGKLLDEQLGDRASAVEQYESALDVDPGHLPSLEAMRRIHVDSGDWLAAARALEQESQHQSQPRVIARLLVELGRIFEDRLDEHERAIETFEAAAKQDPDNEDAILPLAEEYVRTERAAEALPLLDVLVKRSGKREPAEQHRLALMLGQSALAVGELEVATKALGKAHQLDGQDLPTLLALSRAYFDAQNWDQAFKFYQLLLVHHRDALGKDEICDLYYKLGVVKREQGDRRKALNMFDKALEEDPAHRATLEAMVGMYQSANDWEQVIHFKKKLLDLLDGDARFSMLEEIGDLWSEKLQNPHKAIQSYSEASAIKPKHHKLLHKLLGLYQSTQQWDETIDVIQRVSDLDERTLAKSKYAYTIAVVLRDEVKDVDRALEYFGKSLDLDATNLKAFEAINKLLNAKKDWKQLERAYRKMLLRLRDSNDNDLKFNLAHALGVIYRDRIKQPEAAVDVFKIALTYQPDNAMEHQILAELYAVIPGRVEDAIAEHQWLIRQDPFRVESLQALYKLYFESRQYDKAWCLASTLVYLKRADAEQTQFFEQYRPKGVIRPSSRLDDERWLRDLTHPDQDLVTSRIFSVLWPAVLSVRGQQDKDAGLAPKHQVDPATSTVTLAKTFGFVAQVLGIATPRLFLRQDVAGGLVSRPVFPVASLCGSSLLSGYQPQDLMFVCGRHLSDFRGEHFVRTLLASNAELKTVLMAGLAVAGLVPASDPAVAQTVQSLTGKLNPAQIEALRSLGKRFLEAGARTDIKRWLQCVELTACRAGFLLCNDLETSARMINALGAAGPVDLPPKDKLRELVLFSVSEEYFRLRQAIGIQLNLG